MWLFVPVLQGLYYQDPTGASVWECPRLLQVAIDALLPVDKMSRFLEDEAVTVFPEEIIVHAVAQVHAHSHDAGAVLLFMQELVFLSRLACLDDSFVLCI